MKRASAVIHAATLHKPHVATHSWQEFIDTNVTGTLVLLEAAISTGVQSFVYVSTTSAFGSSLSRTGSAPAIWVTEELAAGPRNIYGVTKIMAENLCELAHKQHRLPVIVLRTSRFFAEDDDSKIGLVVDSLIGRREIVSKTLDKRFVSVKGVQGATVLGDGTVSLILDVPALVDDAKDRFYQ